MSLNFYTKVVEKVLDEIFARLRMRYRYRDQTTSDLGFTRRVRTIGYQLMQFVVFILESPHVNEQIRNDDCL